MGDVCVIMCVWNRLEKLDNTIDMLNNQSYKDFDFYIWNNSQNIEVLDKLNSLRKKHLIIKGIYNSDTNVGGLGRFIYASKLNKKYNKVIFIDDDQIFGTDLVLKMVNNFKENSMISWWAWNIRSLDYFDRVRVFDLSSADYCGTGGMIIDSTIFNESIIFDIPERYKFIEDLWLSFIGKYYLNYDLLGYDFGIKIIEDGKDQSLKLLNLKREMYLYLNNLTR